MIQKNYQFDSIEHAVTGLSLIRDEINSAAFKDSLMLIFTTKINGGEAAELIKSVREVLPEIKIAGMSEFMSYEDYWDRKIKINIMLSEEASFYVEQIECLPGDEEMAAAQLRDKMDWIPSIKGVGLFPSGTELSVSKFIEITGKNYENLPVFGAMACTDIQVMQNAKGSLDKEVFGIGEKIMPHGFTAVIFAGEKLNVMMDYVLGWKPLGKDLSIKLGEKKNYGEGCIELIDGKPAVEIYRKYLGIEWDENFVWNVAEFPLMVHRGYEDICMLPLAKGGNGELYFSAPIRESENIRFSYGNRDDILGASEAGRKKMYKFKPEAVFLSMCGNRINYLQDEAHIEWDNYKILFPELVFCHGLYEIGCLNGHGGVLNSSIVAVGFHEKDFEADRNVVSYEPERSHSGPVPLVHRMSHFLNVMTGELLYLQHNLEQEVAIKTHENESLSFHVIKTLADAIDAKDTYTNGHSGRVAEYSLEIARRAGYTTEKQEDLYMMALLHDVGKIGVPDTLINKIGRLDNDEFSIMKNHPVVGAKILSNIEEMPGLAVGAHWHHERFDGQGYPDGLEGYEIPEEARIIAVADAYDAMTSNRSYRSIMTQDAVREQIAKGAGTQFDPRFAKIMLEMIDEDVDYKMHEKT